MIEKKKKTFKKSKEVKETIVKKVVETSASTSQNLLRLDLGCGDNKREGFLGVDIAKTDSTDFQCDLSKAGWPFEDNSVDEVFSAHFLEHLTGAERMVFMNELYRVLKPKAQAIIVIPYWSSIRSIQDPTHQWPPLCESSFLYFNKKWLTDNKLSHYPINCDFDYTFGYIPAEHLLVRNSKFQEFAIKYYLNSVSDIQIALTKRVD